MDEMDEWVEMARSLQLDEVLQMLDLEVARGTVDEGFMFSIFHDEKTPSMHVSGNEVWHDFSTGKGGDVIGLVQAFFGCSFKRAVMFLATQTDPMAVIVKSERKERKVEPPPDLRPVFAHQTGMPKDPELYAELWDWCDGKWGVGLEYLANRFGVLPTPDGTELWAPHRLHSSIFGPMQGQITGIKIRTVPESEKFSHPGSKYVALYSANEFHRDGATAYLVEGESDAWAMRLALDLHSSSDEVFGLPSGVGVQREEWVHALSQFSEQRLCFDDDEAGRKGTDRWGELLPNPKVMNIPGGRVAEGLQQGWAPWTI